jgi:hypothetical protein
MAGSLIPSPFLFTSYGDSNTDRNTYHFHARYLLIELRGRPFRRYTV